MTVRYSLRALADLDAIFAYFDAHAPSTAPALRSTVERAIRLIEQFPHSAPRTDERGVRVLTLVRYRYRIYYTVGAEADVITIVHIRHTSRRPPRRTRR